MKRFICILLLTILVVIPSVNLSAKINVSNDLLKKYKNQYANNIDLKSLKDETFRMGGEAVPVLVKVMKSSDFPLKNRWIATFMLGKIMGKKSSSYISRYLKHPNWVLRMASLKTLLSLNMKEYGEKYALSLKDDSMIVRMQALENIKYFNLNQYAPEVWAMLYDKKNYYAPKNKGKKRSNIIKLIIKTVGDLQFEKAEKPLLKMIQKKKYEDIFNEIDYSLAKIFGKKSPNGDRDIKKFFWKRMALSRETF